MALQIEESELQVENVLKSLTSHPRRFNNLQLYALL